MAAIDHVYIEEGEFVLAQSLIKRYARIAETEGEFSFYCMSQLAHDMFVLEAMREEHGECAPRKCRMLRETPGKQFQSRHMSPPQWLVTTGKVFVCIDSGVIHVCTPEHCRYRQVVQGSGYGTCILTGRVCAHDAVICEEGSRPGEFSFVGMDSGARVNTTAGAPTLQEPAYDYFDPEAACNSGPDTDAPFATQKAAIADACQTERDAEILCAQFDKVVARENLGLGREHAAKADKLCAELCKRAWRRRVWWQHAQAVYQNQILSGRTAARYLEEGQAALEAYDKACQEYIAECGKAGKGVDMRHIHTLCLTHKCAMHARAAHWIGSPERVANLKTSCERPVVDLVVDIWDALHDLPGVRETGMGFRDCVLAILNYMTGAHSNFAESISWGRYGTDGPDDEYEGGLRQLVKVDKKTGRASMVQAHERPDLDQYQLRSLTFVPRVPGLRLEPNSAKAVLPPTQQERLPCSRPSKRSRLRTKALLTSIVSAYKTGSKKNRGSLPRQGFGPPSNPAFSVPKFLPVLLAAAVRAGVEDNVVSRAERHAQSTRTIKFGRLAAGTGYMKSKKNLHRNIRQLLTSGPDEETIARFSFSLPAGARDAYERTCDKYPRPPRPSRDFALVPSGSA